MLVRNEKTEKYYYIANKKDTRFLASTNNDITAITDNFKDALVFPSDKRPKQIIKMLPKCIRRYGIWEIHTRNEEDMKKEIGITGLQSKIKADVKKDINYESLKAELNNASSMMKEVVYNQEFLLKELSDIDLEISDILHYIEFHKFSASEGYKLAKMLQVARDKRRKIKDELDIVEIVKSVDCKSLLNGNLVDRMDSLDSRMYTPRVLTELFKKGENKKRT